MENVNFFLQIKNSFYSWKIENFSKNNTYTTLQTDTFSSGWAGVVSLDQCVPNRGPVALHVLDVSLLHHTWFQLMVD